MVIADVIYKYFPDLSLNQKSSIEQLYPLYLEWNNKINVISRKDIEELYVRHVLHAMSIAKFVDFKNCHTVLDIGTGGGFPGIPLAILFPDIQFHLVDSIGKKIQVVNSIIQDLGLKNVKAEQIRAEQVRDKYDIIVCKAVTGLSEFYGWIHKNTRKDTEVICLKGGDLTEEMNDFRQKFRQKKIKIFNISDVIDLPFFETKKLLLII